MKYINYLLVLLLALVMSFISYGVFSFFGFTEFRMIRKGFFLLVIFIQYALPFAALYWIYDTSTKAEAKYNEDLKSGAEAAKQGFTIKP